MMTLWPSSRAPEESTRFDSYFGTRSLLEALCFGLGLLSLG